MVIAFNSYVVKKIKLIKVIECLMWKVYQQLASQYSRISLEEERQLIAQAQGRSRKKKEELVLRHVNFVIYRIHKKAFPAYVRRFGDDIFSEAIFVLYDKINSYDLGYKDRQGNSKPVRFSSYIWKRIDGLILDAIKKEIQRESCQISPDWERHEQDITASIKN